MGCVAANVNITIYESGTYSKVFQWKTGTPATAVDITGYTAKMDIRTTVPARNEILDITSTTDPWVADGETGIYLTDPVNGEFKLYINDADTTGLCDPAHLDISGVYDIFLYSDEGEAVLKVYGTCTIVAAVTRDA